MMQMLQVPNPIPTLAVTPSLGYGQPYPLARDAAEWLCRWAQEEALGMMGGADPAGAAHTVLHRPQGRAQWVIVKLGSRGSCLYTHTEAVFQPAFQVQPDLAAGHRLTCCYDL